MKFDWLIVGAGYSACVMAERLATQPLQRVLIVQRDHIGNPMTTSGALPQRGRKTQRYSTVCRATWRLQVLRHGSSSGSGTWCV